MTSKILICDKIAEEGIKLLEENGRVIKKAWDMPKTALSKIVDEYDVLIARSAAKVQEALYQAFVSGKVKAAAVDVFEEKPLRNSKLLTLQNVIAVPHIDAQTREAQLRASIEIANNIKALEKNVS